MKKTKKILSVFLALLMMISIIPMSSITASAATTRTADEAIKWCESQLGKTLDYDGAYGGQCVDLTMYYYKYLGVNAVGGNGCDYATNTLPSGWTRTKGGVPQKGDILVYTGGYGHVAIFESTNVSYHQNWGGQYVQKVNRPYNQGYTYDGVTVSYWGCIHPDFKASTPTPTPDWVTGLAGNYYLQNKNDGYWLAISEGKDASTQPINTWGTWNKGFRVKLVAKDDGYKINFPETSTLLMNPYSDTPTVGTKINIYKDVNDSTQWWGFEKVGDAYVIRCIYNPSLVLTSNGVNQATLTTYTGSAKQLWYLHPYTGTVSYNANGGSGAPSSQTKYFNESLTLSSTKPTRSGYTFLGWSTSSTATSASYSAGSSFTTNGNTTLYAVWKANTYTVKYNANGGSGAPSSQTKTHGTTLTLSSTKPTRSGYTFLGWSTSSTATSATYSAGGSFTTNANTTLYAVWKANTYIVSYNANGGSGAPSSQTKTHGTTLTLSKTIPTRSGYTFLGWSTSSTATSATYSAGGSFTTNANTTLYAVWQKNEVTVSSISIATTPNKTEYTVGEAFDSDGLSIKVKMSDGTTKTITSGFTITTPDMSTAGTKTVTVTYEGKSTTFEIVVKENNFVPDAECTISIQTPSRTEIRHNDGIFLHANVEGELPEGAIIEWSVNNNNFDGGYTEDGMQCLLISKNNGYTVITVTIYDTDENVISEDSIEMRSKAGFFDKIGGFFRSLFGSTTIYEN